MHATTTLRWEHRITDFEAERMRAAFALDRKEREIRGALRRVIGLRPMQWKHHTATATEIAAAYGFVPEVPGEFMVWQTVGMPATLQWNAGR